MKALLPYKDLETTLLYLKIQVFDSIPYAAANCPNFKDPKKLFYWLKSKLNYTPDGRNEHLQTMQTLFKNGGRGDCDCFVITTLACFYVLGWGNKASVILTGRDKKNAVHIYTSIKFNGKNYIFDLTNKNFDNERFYPYFQSLKFKFK